MTIPTYDVEILKPVIIEMGLIAPDILNDIIEKTQHKGESLLDCIFKDGLLDVSSIDCLTQKTYGLPFIELTKREINPQIARLLPERIVKGRMIMPFDKKDKILFLAMLQPCTLPEIDNLEMLSGYEIVSYITTKTELAHTINRYFDVKHLMRQSLIDLRMDKIATDRSELELTDSKSVDTLKRHVEDASLDDGLDEEPIVRLVNSIITGAISARASDIHLEPRLPEMKVRFRIDGVLQDVVEVPQHIQDAVISRIKILANMDITKKRQPQDGHITMQTNDGDYYFRVSSLLTVNGEKVVLRIHDKSTKLMSLNELGFDNEELSRVETLLARSYGMILVCGPTGSGKTTTLYTALNKINEPTKNIITLEDPVEYQIQGINQVQVNPHDDITFEKGLSYILRQDPNIIMIGEIRDKPPAESAVQASLTGHLVLSTLHTNDAPGTITRLIDMGIQNFQIASSLIGVISQRLVRRVCTACFSLYSPKKEEFDRLSIPYNENVRFVRGAGCTFCYGTGYFGRTGVFEVMLVTDNIRKAIMSSQPASEIEKIAVSEGMKTMQMNAAHRVLSHTTTFEEATQVIDFLKN